MQSESAWALTNITSGNTCHAKFHASEVSGSEKKRFQYFSVYFFGSNPGHPGEDQFWTLVPLSEQTNYVKHHKTMLHTKFQAVEPGDEGF